MPITYLGVASMLGRALGYVGLCLLGVRVGIRVRVDQNGRGFDRDLEDA